MKVFHILLLSVFLSGSVVSIAQWEWQLPLPQGNKLNDIAIIDEQNIIAVGDYGAIVNSSDGGQTWQKIETYITQHLQSVCFPTNNTGYIVGNGGIFLKSTDGGHSWFELNFYNSSVDLSQIFMIDEFNGWVILQNDSFIHTVDAFETITSLDIIGYKSLKQLFFIDENIGWGLTYEDIYYTIDAGETWLLQESLTSGSIQSIFFLNELEGWASCNNGIIYKTIDGGSNWLKIETNVNDWLSEIKMIDSNNGLVVSFYGPIFKTEDGGESLSFVHEINSNPHCVELIDNNRALVLFYNGEILQSNNQWMSWENMSIGYQFGSFFDVQFIDDQVGFAVSTGGYVLKTISSGENWYPILESTNNAFYSIEVFTENNLLVTSHYGEVLKTNNGGDSWDIINTEVPNGFCTSFFINENIGWIAGYTGYVLKTTNGGESWETQYTHPYPCFDFESIFFLNENQGWIAGDNGTVIHTLNGGQDWHEIPNLDDNSYNDIFFINENIGWLAGGTYTKIFKTVDGGNLWELQNSHVDKSYYVYELFMFDAENGYAVGSAGLFMKTFDGGNNWYQKKSFTDKNLVSLYFTDINTGWIVGIWSTILKTSNGGNLRIEDNNKMNIAPKTNCYPNPFDVSTSITFDLINSGEISIDLYNISGNFIKNIFTGHRNRGNNKIEMQGRYLEYGVYFYVINSSEGRFINKIIHTN